MTLLEAMKEHKKEWDKHKGNSKMHWTLFKKFLALLKKHKLISKYEHDQVIKFLTKYKHLRKLAYGVHKQWMQHLGLEKGAKKKQGIEIGIASKYHKLFKKYGLLSKNEHG